MTFVYFPEKNLLYNGHRKDILLIFWRTKNIGGKSMKGKVLSILTIIGIILLLGLSNNWGQEDKFKIMENANAIESHQELKMEKIGGYDIIGSFGNEDFVVKQKSFSNNEGPIKEILIRDVKNNDKQSIDLSNLNIRARSIWNVQESNGYLYFTARKNNKAKEDVAYEINIDSKEIKDISNYIKENESIYHSDNQKSLILANKNEGRIKNLSKDLKEIQNFQLPVKKGENDIYYDNNIVSIKKEDAKITKVYFIREKMKKDGYMGLDEILSKEAYVYDAALGAEKILPFKETILNMNERNGNIFIEEKRGDNVYLTQKDENGKTLNEEFLYNRKKGYLRKKVEISPNGEYGVMHFIRTFDKNNKSIEELYLIDMKNHKKFKFMAFEEGEGTFHNIIWSKNGKNLGVNLLNNIAQELEYCIIKIEDII